MRLKGRCDEMKMKKTMRMLTAVLIVLCLAILPAMAEENAKSIELTGHIVILHTGDVHGRADTNLGFSRVTYAKDVLEGAGATVLLLDAGDALHGLPFANISEGESIVRLMEDAGYDAMAVGSHDFSYGADRLSELAAKAKFSMLAGNVMKEGVGSLLPGDMIFEINHVKFGIFALTTPETAHKTDPANTEGLTFMDPIEWAKMEVEGMEKENCTIIIALTHLGMDENSEITSKMLAEQVPGIDVIVDGGSHTLLEEGMWVNNTLIVSAGEYLENIGCVDIDPTGLTAATMLTAQDFGEASRNEMTDQLIAEIAAEQEKILKESVGRAAAELVGAQEAVCGGETNLGNLAADALRSVTGAEIALINGGSICESISAGEITRGQLAAVFPQGHYAVTMNVTGAQLLSLLENGVSLSPAADGRFPQVSGLTFRFDSAQPAGSRVFDVKVNGEALDAEKTYSMATSDYIADGGDGYPVEGLSVTGGYGALEEILTSYIASFEAAVEPEVEGRSVPAAKPAD